MDWVRFGLVIDAVYPVPSIVNTDVKPSNIPIDYIYYKNMCIIIEGCLFEEFRENRICAPT